jgi:hypothetical protein
VVAVAEKRREAEPVAEGSAHRARPRTPAQQKLLADHADLVRNRFRTRDPRLVRILLDETPLWTEDLVRMFGITEQRTYVLYSHGRDLAEAGYMIHPGGIPVPDTSGGFRGDSEIRGISRGRLALWALGAHRAIWNPETGEITWIDADSTASLVARARAALDNPAVPAHYRPILQARVDNPDLTTTQIAERLGTTKAQFTSKLRRALHAAEQRS